MTTRISPAARFLPEHRAICRRCLAGEECGAAYVLSLCALRSRGRRAKSPLTVTSNRRSPR